MWTDTGTQSNLSFLLYILISKMFTLSNANNILIHVCTPSVSHWQCECVCVCVRVVDRLPCVTQMLRQNRLVASPLISFSFCHPPTHTHTRTHTAVCIELHSLFSHFFKSCHPSFSSQFFFCPSFTSFLNRSQHVFPPASHRLQWNLLRLSATYFTAPKPLKTSQSKVGRKPS